MGQKFCVFNDGQYRTNSWQAGKPTLAQNGQKVPLLVKKDRAHSAKPW